MRDPVRVHPTVLRVQTNLAEPCPQYFKPVAGDGDVVYVKLTQLNPLEILHRLQMLVDQAYGDGSLANGRSHAPDRALAYISGCEDSRDAGLQ